MANPTRVPKHGERMYDYVQWWKSANPGQDPGENIDPGDPRTYDSTIAQWVNKAPEPTTPPGGPGGPGGGGGGVGGAGGGGALLGLQMSEPPAPSQGSQLGGFRGGLGQRQHPPLVSPLAGLQRIY